MIVFVTRLIIQLTYSNGEKHLSLDNDWNHPLNIGCLVHGYRVIEQ